MKVKKTTVQLQLSVLGFVALTIAWFVVLAGNLGYGFSWFSSISESATTGNLTGQLLPYFLGMMSLFALCYKGYDKLDFWITKLMFVGFTIVSMQMCISPYNEMLPAIGLFAVAPTTSNMIHNIGAITGFGAMIYWISFCFTKSNKIVSKQTKQKRIRNKIYQTCGILSCLGILWFVIGKYITPSLPNIWIAEMLILTPCAIAVLVKAETFGLLADKE